MQDHDFDNGPAPDFDALVAGVSRNPGDESMDQLWRAVYGLERWHFIGRTADDNVYPMVGMVDGSPHVMAFTDEQRATEFVGETEAENDEDQNVVISLSVAEAVEALPQLGEHGVAGILFNNGPNGFLAPLADIEPMHEFYCGDGEISEDDDE